MGKVNFTAAIAEIRNKVGGSVYARNRYGAYVRDYVIPTNPNTSWQQIFRNNFKSISESWKSLTEEQRTMWREAALRVVRSDVFGKQSNLSGFQYYMQLNIDMILLDNPPNAVPPELVAMPVIANFSLSLDIGASEFLMSFDDYVSDTDYTYIIRATSAQSQGAVYFKNKYYVIGVANDGTGDPFNIYDVYTAKYAGFISNTRIGVQAYLVNNVTGQRGKAVNNYIDVS